MKGSVHLLSTPTAETAGSSLVLTFDDKRYIFGNVHEGLQRVCTQNGVRLGRLGNIFLTGKTEWRTTGGLMGFILTVADVMQSAVQDYKKNVEESQEKWEATRATLKSPAAIQKFESLPQPKNKIDKVEMPEMMIHGGDNIMQLLATARRFIFRRGMPLKIHEHADSVSTATPTWEDHNIQVWAMPLRPQHSSTDDNGKSPRKRSFDDYSRNDDVAIGEPSNSRAHRLQGILSDMFDSDWRLDALFETQLSQVKAPTAIFVRNPETKNLEKYEGPMPGAGQDVPDIKVLVRKPWPGAMITELPATKPSLVSMSYIVKHQPRRGKFNKELAIQLGIKPGPAFSQLTKGASIKTADGRIITPEQVTGPMINGRGFAVIELPTAEYIPSLKGMAAFKNEAIMEEIEAIFWLLGPGITNIPSFQELIKKHPNRKHIISSVDHCANYLSMDSAAAAQIKHREIDDLRFDLPLHDNATVKLPQEISDCTIAHRGVNLDIAPEVVFTTTMEPGLLNTVEVVQRTPKAVKALAREAHQELKQPDFIKAYQNQELPEDEAEIVTLGTGSAVPSKTRNVSATLLRIPNVGSYLLDCGEGTMGQLARIYAPEELQQILKDLKLVWISHMHADHHLGLTSLIKAWHTAVYGDSQEMKPNEDQSIDQVANPVKDLEEQQRLCIVSESDMLLWLKEYSEIENFGYDRIVPLHVKPVVFDEKDNILTSTKFEWNNKALGFQTANPRVNMAMRKITGLANLQSVYVNHCSGARAVAMTWPSGLKISYSGDCRPSKRFAVIGRDSTILIHEATFDDALSGDAQAKKHSTTREAIGVGLEMRAKRIILTHFSQRYSKIPTLENVVAKPIDFEDFIQTRSDDNTDPTDIELTTRLDEEHGEETSGNPNSPQAETKDQSPKNGRRSPTSLTYNLAAVKEIKIGIAFDLMRVKIKDIIALEKFKAAFSKLSTEGEISDEELAAKKMEAASTKEKREEFNKQKAERRRQKQIAASSGKSSRRNSGNESTMQI